MTSTALEGLPGSSADPGHGPPVPELFDGLLDVATDDLAGYRNHRAAWYGDLVGPLLLDSARASQVLDRATTADHALPVLLVGARQEVRAARDLLAEDDRFEVVGVRLELPQGSHPASQDDGRAARVLLEALDFTAPAWIGLPIRRDWRSAMRVIAEDGAESIALDDEGADDDQRAAAALREAVDLDLAMRLAGPGRALLSGQGGRYGWLNVLCAVRAALNGTEGAALAAILTATDAAALTSAARRMSEADAAVTRAFLAGIEVDDVDATLAGLLALGLIARRD